MPRVHHVKSARKADPNNDIKVGDSYYWWKHKLAYGGLMRKSKVYPKPSQLTLSSFWSAVLATKENYDTPTNTDDLEAHRDSIVSDLEGIRDETQEKLENMPEGLQQGNTGEQLQSRISSVEEAISTIESVDCDCEIDEGWNNESRYQRECRMKQELEEKLEEHWQEIQDALDNISD